MLIGLIIALTGWAWGARVLRAQTLSLRSRDYVDVGPDHRRARLAGDLTSRSCPTCCRSWPSSFLFTVLYGVGTYTALAFLGLVNPEHWSWGSMLFEAQNADAELSGYWWWYIPPGLAVAFLGTVAGAAQLRHRRVHQPAAARGRGDPPPVAASRAGRACPGASSWASPPWSAADARPRSRRQHGNRQHGRPQPAPAGAPPGSRRRDRAQPLLEIRGLRVDYGAGPGAVHAVVDADLMLRRGEVLGLAGESGSGKSTLAYAVDPAAPRARR